MFCPNCGKGVDDNFKFCPECGFNLKSTDTEPAEEIVPVDTEPVEVSVEVTVDIADEASEIEAAVDIADEASEIEAAVDIADEAAEIEAAVDIADEAAESTEDIEQQPEQQPETHPEQQPAEQPEVQTEEQPETQPEQPHESPLADKKKPLNAIIVSVTAFIALSLLAGSLLLYFGYFHSNGAVPAYSSRAFASTSASAAPHEKIEIENIYIPEKEMTLFEGQSKRVIMDIYPKNAQTDEIEWISDGDGVAVSDDGRVMGISAGSESVVTVSCGNISASVSVRVLTKDEAFFEAVEQITNKEQYQKVDLDEQNFSPQPIKRELTLLEESETRRKWGANLFARINDELQTYEAEQKQLINSETGNRIDCDVYRTPSDGNGGRGDVRKIVTAEHYADYIKVTDYYYINGKVGFIFEKNETGYSPAPANWGTEGIRLYFEDDAMTTWRDVSRADKNLQREESFIKTDYSFGRDGLEWTRTEYTFDSQTGVVKNLKETSPYVEASESERIKKLDEYKALEAKAINAAYNIYSKIAELPEIVSFSGSVSDADAVPLAGASVRVFSEQYGMLVFQTVTGDDGQYEATVPRTEQPYTISVSESGFLTSYIYDVDAGSSSGKSMPPVIMIEESSEPATAFLSLVSDTGEPAEAYARGCTFKLRRGLNNRTGETAYAVALPPYLNINDSEESGEISFTVSGNLQMRYLPDMDFYEITAPAGSYTAELVSPGYESVFFPLHLTADTITPVRAVLVPTIIGDEMKIVLTWENENAVLEPLLLFPSGEYTSPDKSVDADAEQTDSDAAQTNNISSKQETISIPRSSRGSYGFYITDENASVKLNDSSAESLSKALASVSVYRKGGLAAEFHAPANASGSVWHVFNMTDGDISPVGKCYDSIGE